MENSKYFYGMKIIYKILKKAPFAPTFSHHQLIDKYITCFVLKIKFYMMPTNSLEF